MRVILAAWIVGTAFGWTLPVAHSAARAAALAAEPASQQAAEGLSGVLRDLYTGNPLPEAVLELTSVHCGLKPITRTTDAQGQFRFEEVAKCRPTDLMLLTVRACKDCQPQSPSGEGGKALPLFAAPKELEAIFVANDALARQTFGPLCDGKSSQPVPAVGVPIVVLQWDVKRAAWGGVSPGLSRYTSLDLPWPALVCTRSLSTLAGQYGIGTQGAKAYSVIETVILVRLRDGKRFETTVTARPPEKAEAQGFDQRGNTYPLVVAWVRQIVAENP